MIRGLKHNRHLLIGSPHKVTVRTDHENLAHYRHPQKINRRVARYLHTLADFDLELKHIPGPTNKADGLSRRPDHDDGSEDNEEVVALPEALFVHAIQIGKLKRDIRDNQQKADQQIWINDHGCQQEEGILYHEGTLVVVDHRTKAKEILQRYHDSITAGHPGIWKTWQAVRQDFWWPKMRQYIAKYIEGCATCQSKKTITRRNVPPLQPIGSKEGAVPFSTIVMDFVTKLPLSQGFDTILTVTDQGCTKAVILVPCKETDRTKEIADLFKDRVFPYSGVPQKIISDRDTRFTSEYHKKLCATLGIEQNLSTAYHPQTDGQSERTNQTMEDLL